MRKILPLVASLALLSGVSGLHAQETDFPGRVKIDAPSPIEKMLDGASFDIKQNGNDFYLSALMPLGNGFKIGLGAEESDGELKKISGKAGWVGEHGFYIGGTYKKFDSDLILMGANMFKGQAGFMLFDNFLNGFVSGARIDIPNMKVDISSLGYGIYATPLKLYAVGFGLNLRPKFELGKEGKVKLYPWFSTIGSFYEQDLKETDDIKRLRADMQDTALKSGSPQENDNSFTLPFNHLKAGIGTDLEVGNFYGGLNFVFEGNPFWYFSPVPTANLNAGFNIEESTLAYNLTVIPDYNLFDKSLYLNFESSVDGFIKLPFNFYVKENMRLNHSNPKDFNLITILGFSKDKANFEIFYNLKGSSFGFRIYSPLEKIVNEKNYTPRSFHNLGPVSKPNMIGYEGARSGDVSLIHTVWGEDVSDVIKKIRSETGGYSDGMQKIMDYISYFDQKDHSGRTFSPDEEHDAGYGVCADTMGELLPAVINGVLHDRGVKKASGETLGGPYVKHAVTVIEKDNGKYDAVNYERGYVPLDADTYWDAIEDLFPGAYMYELKYSYTSQEVIDAVEESLGEGFF